MNATEKKEGGLYLQIPRCFRVSRIRYALFRVRNRSHEIRGEEARMYHFRRRRHEQFSIYVLTYLSFSFSVFLVNANYYTSDYPESFVPIGVRCGVFNVSFSVDGTHIFRADVFLVVLERGHRLEE